MTHENKQKFWLFYTKDDINPSEYQLYAFTDDKSLAKKFIESRCMDRFYQKVVKIDRMNYNELIRSHMTCELELFDGLCRLDSSDKCHTFSLPLTKQEKRRILTNESIILHEKLYTYVWEDIGVLQDKYIEALWALGYPALQTYITIGDNPIHKTVEDAFLPNDMNFLLDVCGWSFVPERVDVD